MLLLENKELKNEINYFILFPLILFCIYFSGCKVQKSTLIIKNWPYTGTGKITIYIDQYHQAKETKKNNGITEEQRKRRAELRAEHTNEELVEIIAEMILKSMQENENNTETNRVAKYISGSLNSPFKLLNNDDNDNWTGSGNYNVRIYVPDETILRIEKTNVVFSEGTAIIDYNDMDVIPKNKKRE